MKSELSERSKQVRRDTLDLSKANGGYHYGGCFSIVEILIVLFDSILRPEDKFILSKGHACWPYYVLLREKGFDPKLEGHPCLDEENGVNCTTGSEGHGLPTAVGMAFARKIKKAPGRVFVMIGDGECQEGTTWESLLTGRQHTLDNLTVIVDWNRFQGAGSVVETLSLKGLGEVARMLGWAVVNIDGHATNEIVAALNYFEVSAPLLIIAHTVKGKGISFMENKGEWHARWPGPDDEKKMREELK